MIGLGLDLCRAERMRKVWQRHGERFLARFLRPEEQAYCLEHRDPGDRLAGRWAAKEAAIKALGTGEAQGVRMLDCEVVHDPSGAPRLVLHGIAAERATVLGVRGSMLSITHDGGMAAAVVVLL